MTSAASGARGHGRGLRGTGVAGAALLVCAVLVLLGALIAAGEHVRADPSLVSAAERGSVADFEVRLAGFPETRRSAFGERSWVRAEALASRGAVPVLLWLDEPPEPAWAPGTPLRVRGVLERFAPGSSEAFGVDVLALRAVERPSAAGITGEITAEGIGEMIRERIGEAAAALRSGLRERSEAVPGAALVPGFAVGDTALVGDDLDRAMTESSLAHLTAVSGANCALVTGAVIWLLGRLGAGRRLRAVAAGCGLALFVVLVGPDPSVQRAAVMAAVLLASGFGGKRATALPSLGLAVIALLVADPWQALRAGFALSVAATAGILLLAAPLGRWLRRRARLPGPLSLPVAVALAAQLACGPLLLLLQPGIPAAGVLANVIAAPAAPLGTGLGLAAALLGPLGAGLAHWAVLAASLPAQWVEATARFTAELPAARWHWPEGWAGALLLAACEAALLLAWALRRGHAGLPWGIRVNPRLPWMPPPPAPRAIRASAAALACAALGVVVAVTLVTPLAERLGTPSGWAVVACDVGQGDALLLRDPASPGETMLVDTGDDPEALLRCLDRFGIRRIALLVLTHDDRDHVGALPAVLDRVGAALISPGVRGEDPGAREVLRQLGRARIPHRIGVAGEGRETEAGVAWRVLAPTAGAEPADSNAASLVIAARAGPASVLLLADTGLDEQRALLRDAAGAAGGSLLGAHVLKVAHHGSRDQDPGLPALVGAEWALVSVGAGNRYGHPAPDTLGALARAGTRVLRTDLHGSIALIPDGAGALRAWVERAPGFPEDSGDEASAHPPATSEVAPRLEGWQQAKRRSRRSGTTRRAPHPSS